MSTVKHGESFVIRSFRDRPDGTSIDIPEFVPFSVIRTSDREVFTIGDRVTNGMTWKGGKCEGNITEFTLLNGTMFVSHTWNGVGWNLESLTKVISLPSQHQPGDAIHFCLPNTEKIYGWVISTRFYQGKVKYDLELTLSDKSSTRIYNIDSVLVEKFV